MTKSDNMYYATLYKKPQRIPQSESDWGDDQTIGICLKRIGLSFFNSNIDSFGIFLGDAVVGVQHVLTYEFLYFEIFETMDELKQYWECD